MTVMQGISRTLRSALPSECWLHGPLQAVLPSLAVLVGPSLRTASPPSPRAPVEDKRASRAAAEVEDHQLQECDRRIPERSYDDHENGNAELATEHMFLTLGFLENVGSLRREFGHGGASDVCEVNQKTPLDTPLWQDNADGQPKSDSDQMEEDVVKHEQLHTTQHLEQLNHDQKCNETFT